MTAVICVLSIFGGCGEKDSAETQHAGRDLYKSSALLIADFTKRMAAATDSASLDSINRLFEHRLDSLNMSFPPETDYLLTEGENDTLALLTRRLIQTREKKRRVIPDQPDSDSIPREQ